MLTVAEYSIEEILPLIGVGKPSKFFTTDRGTFKVRMSGTRMECFRRSLECVWCKRTGNVFLLQSHQKGLPKGNVACYIEECPWCAMHPRRHNLKEGQTRPHLNLYHRGKNGSLLLMTQDHILARSRGGLDRIENLQTMCSQCNRHKGSDLAHEFDAHGHRITTAVDGGSSILQGLSEVQPAAA